MTTKIKATNIEITDDIRNYLDKKLKKVEELIGDDPTLIVETELERTTAHQSGDIFRAEINLNFKGQQFRAESKKENLYSAIDEAQEEIIRTQTKVKGKKTSVIKRSGRALKDLIRRFYK